MKNNIVVNFNLLVLPIVLSLSCTTIDYSKRMNQSQDSLLSSIFNMQLVNSLKALDDDASSLVDKKFNTVLDKKIIAPSGDKKDYTSRAIYYWPKSNLQKSANQNEAWEYKDGKINQESLTSTDHNNYYEMLEAVKKLSLSYYLFNKEEYAKKAVKLINEWFIDDETRMNPHFKHAQAIPGLNTGTSSGIIDSRGILWVIDAMKLIENSDFWNEELNSAFSDWGEDLLDWLLNSDFGKIQAKKINNHGTIYYLQIIKLAAFLEQNDLAIKKITEFKTSNLVKQINKDGKQPAELERADPHMYSILNLSSMIEIALIAENYDINLWDYSSDTSGSIQDAVDLLVESYKYNRTDLFKNNPNYKNLIKILPKANLISKGRYINTFEKLKKEIGYVNFQQIYFSI